MGIPKFYRWTSERYPCLSERIKEYQIPEFDNLYLDMNGIIHNCSHPNDEDIHLRIPEQQIFKDIFHYIDFLFKMIKPCKVFFMAVDGVAPRAKMNQQRGRRFRSARLAEDQEAEAIRKGETLPSEDRFDSNCITPGTEFMSRLHEQLKYFVQVKVSTDPLWQRQGLVIYLSGHDVPGEGEHKIMDFIRHIRSKSDYVPVRHCLYGLDADLVMLGLSTHELQFSLLREEVKFSRPKKPKKGPKKPPKQSPLPASSYDLSRVTIFNNDSQSLANLKDGKRMDGKPFEISFCSGPQSSLVKDGTSFLEALEKPVELVSIKNNKIEEEKKEEEVAVVPPAPDDSKAKGVYRAPLPEKTTFLLLHLSLMRDYIDFEFQELKQILESKEYKIQYDLEKLIDDWILMNILVGNDFVPHLPHFHIVKGALPLLYQIYTEVLPTLDGYINENGVLNLSRFEVFIKKLSQFDIDNFRETYDDMKYMESKTGKNIVLGEKMFENFDFDNNDDFKDDEPLEPVNAELAALAQRTEEEVFGLEKTPAAELFAPEDDFYSPEDSPELRLEFLQHKRNYYISKLELGGISPQFLEHFCKEYIRALQWVLLYYYKGVSSWGWFYPYHYAPFCSDLKDFANFTIEFDKGQPFKPFEQLLAVLPAQSKKLLPSCYQWLMTDDKSPIVDFYPQKFEQDLNGKKQDWEAVVLIPFIDEMKLLTVMENEENNLNVEEVHRNRRGTMMLYSHSKEATGPVKSPQDLFPTLETSNVHIETMGEVTYNPQTLPNGIHPKSKLDAIYQGFPTLRTKPVRAIVEKADIKVFEFVTREESMTLGLEEASDETADLTAIARKLIGRSVWVNWPHLTFATVTSVLTRKAHFYQDYGRIVKDPDLIGSRVEKEFDSVAKGLTQRHLKCKGIKLGDLHVIIYAKMMEGRKVKCDSQGNVHFETLWSNLEQPFALKTCMYEEDITEIFYLDRTLATNYMDLYKIGDQVFYLGDKAFGASGVVVGHNQEKRTVNVELNFPSESEINLKSIIGRNTLRSNEYFNPQTASQKCGISSYTLSRITGSVYISVEKETKAAKKLLAKKVALARLMENASPPDATDASSSSDEDFPALAQPMRKINVGLDLKFNKKNLEVRGYTSKRDGKWYYSSKAIELVNDFVSQFSDFMRFFARTENGKDGFDASEIFPTDSLNRINEMVEWLEEKGVRDLPRIQTNTNLLDDEDIDSVWKAILENSQPSKKQPTKKKWSVRPNLLLKPGVDRGCVPPIPQTSYNILDRVVCVDRGAPIPVGYRGTIVGVQAPQASEPEQIEESFKSTGAATLMTLIVLVDPAPDVFDRAEDFQFGNNKSQALASLLKISSKSIAPVVELKPRLIKLYPYQLLNITQGPELLREAHRDSKQLRNLDSFPSNGHARPQYPVKILQRPANDVKVYDVKAVVAQNSKAPAKGKTTTVVSKPKLNGTVTSETNGTGKSDLVLPWPPQPKAASIDESFSVAAFLQQQFKAGPVANSAPPATTTSSSNSNPTISKSTIFSSATAYVPPTPSQNQASTSKPTNATKSSDEKQNILQMLSKAADEYQSSSANSKTKNKSKEKGTAPNTVMQQQTKMQTNYNPTIPKSNPRHPPPPPSNWISSPQQPQHVPQQFTPQPYNTYFYGPPQFYPQLPHMVPIYPFGIPPPQMVSVAPHYPHQSQHPNNNNNNSGFVPLQVSRNQAGGQARGPRPRNRNPRTTQQQSYIQELPNQVDQEESSEKAQKPTQHFYTAPNTRTEDKNEQGTRKSRLAANFGNMS